jgi:hypothetical protein
MDNVRIVTAVGLVLGIAFRYVAAKDTKNITFGM